MDTLAKRAGRKAILGIAVLAAIFGLVIAVAQTAQASSFSGTCGDSLGWTFDTDTGALSITGSGAMEKYDSSASVPWNSYSSDVKSVNISSSTTSISGFAFYECASLKTITIPSSVTSIGSSAFLGCTSLESIGIPSSLTSLGACAFYRCSSLKSITIPSKITYIGICTFYGCTSLASVVIPSSVAHIGLSAFYGCTPLYAHIPSDCSIGTNAFYNCKGYESCTCIEKPACSSWTYDGSTKTAALAADGYTLSGTSSAVNAGSYSLKAVLARGYMWNDGTITAVNMPWKIAKAKQPGGKIATKTKTVKGCAKGKLKKAKKFKLKRSGIKGGAKVSFKKLKGSKKITVTKTGKVTVKKGLKKGIYKVKVRMTIKATTNYTSKTVTKTIRIRVK